MIDPKDCEHRQGGAMTYQPHQSEDVTLKTKSQVAQEALDALDGLFGPVVAGLRRHLQRERDLALEEEAAGVESDGGETD